MTGEPLLDLDAFRAAFAAWLDDHDDLVTRQRQCFSLELLDVATVQQEFQEELFAGGWVRYGWPDDLGGLGGDARHRAALYDELGRRRVPIPESYLTIETLIPMLSVHAPDLARAHLTNLLRGAERWCQGFSEPDAGSDLASLRTKAVRDGDDWIVDGHKIWTSQATVSQRCVVLLRTGTPESRHRGLSMMLVDHDAPGVEVREIRTMSGRDELGEVLFDGVRVAGDRLIGNDGDGWALAMYLLQWERGMYPWQRQAGLLGTLDMLLERSGDAIDPHALGRRLPRGPPDATLVRADDPPIGRGGDPRPRGVGRQGAPGASGAHGVRPGRHGVRRRDRVRRRRAGTRGSRHDYLFSRSAPIYGGSYEIQRQILADRVLGMPRG